MQISPLKGLISQALTSWLEPTPSVWRDERGNGMTAGFYNKIEMLSGPANSFTNSGIRSSDEDDAKLHISEIYQWPGEDKQRNIEIVDDVLTAVKEGRT